MATTTWTCSHLRSRFILTGVMIVLLFQVLALYSVGATAATAAAAAASPASSSRTALVKASSSSATASLLHPSACFAALSPPQCLSPPEVADRWNRRCQNTSIDEIIARRRRRSAITTTRSKRWMLSSSTTKDVVPTSTRRPDIGGHSGPGQRRSFYYAPRAAAGTTIEVAAVGLRRQRRHPFPVACDTLVPMASSSSDSNDTDGNDNDDEKFGFFQRIESVKALVLGGIVGSVAMAPLAGLYDLFLYDKFATVTTNGLAQWEFDCDMASFESGLFAIVYRYCIREDTTNEQLKSGVVGAFALTRALSKVVVSPYCTAITLDCKDTRSHRRSRVSPLSPFCNVVVIG